MAVAVAVVVSVVVVAVAVTMAAVGLISPPGLIAAVRGFCA